MVRLKEHPRVAVVGLGNVLLTDDGVGVHAVRKLKDNAPAGITVAEIGTAVLGALELFENTGIIIAIDAVKAGGPPGSVYCLDIEDVCVSGGISAHDHGVSAALHHLPAESRPQVVILGVEPDVVACGMELSPKVRAVLPRVVEIASVMAEQAMKYEKGVLCPEIPGIEDGNLQQWEFKHEEI